MTKLEELKKVWYEAGTDYIKADEAFDEARAAYIEADKAYYKELEKQND